MNLTLTADLEPVSFLETLLKDNSHADVAAFLAKMTAELLGHCNDTPKICKTLFEPFEQHLVEHMQEILVLPDAFEPFEFMNFTVNGNGDCDFCGSHKVTADQTSMQNYEHPAECEYSCEVCEKTWY